MALSLARHDLFSDAGADGEVLHSVEPSAAADQQRRWLRIVELQVGHLGDGFLTPLEVILEVTAVRGLPIFAARIVDHQFHLLRDLDGGGYARLNHSPCISKIQYPKTVRQDADPSTVNWGQTCDERVSCQPIDTDGEVIAANTAGILFREENIAGLSIASEDKAFGDVLWT